MGRESNSRLSSKIVELCVTVVLMMHDTFVAQSPVTDFWVKQIKMHHTNTAV